MHKEYPILEFDSALEAILEPKRLIHPIDIPERAVVCFLAVKSMLILKL